MRPRAELSIPTKAAESTKNLYPHILRDVGGKVGISSEPPHHCIDVRRVLRPELPQRPLITVDGALDYQAICMHVVHLIRHGPATKGCWCYSLFRLPTTDYQLPTL